MALSADEITYIRYNTGNKPSTSDFYVNDTYLNYIYANQANSSVDAVIALEYRRMMSIAAPKVNFSNSETAQSLSSNQEYMALAELSKKWDAIAGIGAQTAQAYTISLGIDTEE